MKKTLALLVLILTLGSLFACGPADDTPEGMQLVFGGEDEGYYFYAPEEWLISNVGAIKSAYISRVNTTSVSFAEVKLDGKKDKTAYFFDSYFDEYVSEFSVMPTFNLKENGKACTFGTGEYAAARAEQYIYTYEYLEYEFCFMQILVQHGERFFLFTYSAQNTAEEGVTPNYEKYLEKAQSVIENFRFVGEKKPDENKTEYVRDEDGYKLISDKAFAGFDFYVPDSFNPDFSSAIVSASHPDGSSVNITEATATGISADKYWETRKSDLSKIFTEVTEISANTETRLGNNSSMLYGDWAYAYEYTFIHNGSKYHVYQILAIDGTKGYVFTYTALEENYLAHLDEIMAIIEKVHF